jgi:hypothetical protein
MCLRLLLSLALFAAMACAADPKMIAFSASPNGYLNDHAASIAKLYDGFFFGSGSWEDAVKRFEGANGAAPEAKPWMDEVHQNLLSLRRAGVTENLLTVHWPANGRHPRPETIFSKEFTAYMETQFAALGRTAKRLGFRGVCLDLEYAADMWEIHHKQYRFENYSVEDVLETVRRQGHQAMSALLDAYPNAVIFVLPGNLRHWAVDAYYQLGLIEAMAERDAPGGLHFGSEWTYYVRDRLATMGCTRFEDTAVEQLTSPKVASYWKRRCSVAPGVWPLHMSETDRTDVPVRPWKEEVGEIREQMRVLRGTAKFYMWSFTATPYYYQYTPELEQKYKLPKQTQKYADIDVRDWHRILVEKPVIVPDDPLYRQVRAMRRWDRSEISAVEMCDSFAAPQQWWLLGLTGSLRHAPHLAAMRAATGPIRPFESHIGRDIGIHWTPLDSLNPMATTNLRYYYGYRGTDDSGAHLATFIHSPRAQKGFLDIGWDDGMRVYLGDKIVLDALDFPPKGKGMVRNDSLLIEKRIPVDIPAGRTRLTITTMNATGLWIYCLRFTDEQGVPLPDLKFRRE